MASYWTRFSNRRLSRRRALTIGGSTTAGALFLAACGSDSGGSPTGGTATGGTGGSNGTGNGSTENGIVSPAVDTLSQAQRGGTLKWFGAAEPAHFDSNTGLAPLNTPNNLATSLLVNEKAGRLSPPEYSDVVPDLAESWEWSPDGLQLTMTIRDGVKWHNKAPVNGRALDVDDILASWARFAEKSQGRGNLSNAANPNAPVLDVTATDAHTIVFTLKDPVVYFLSMLTPNQTGSFQMMPKEADDTLDVRQNLIGTGPFVMTEYVPSQGITFDRNPEYWDAENGPFVDRIEYPFVNEYVQQVAQLRAGNIHTLFGVTGSGMRQDDVLVNKREISDLSVFAVQPWGFNPGVALQFGTQPTEANAAFKDERVRQAFSMAHDRAAYIDVFGNVSNFEAEGLPVDTHWFTSLGPAPGWRLDPRDEAAFGPNAQYFQHNPEEAKRLLEAAGYGDGLDIIASFISGPELNTNGRPYHQQIEVRLEMLREVGINHTPNLIDYTQEYLPRYITNAGRFDGILFRVGVAASNDAVVWSAWRYKTASGDGWIGFDVEGTGDGSGDPEVDSLIERASREQDIEARKALMFDLQRYLAKASYLISEPGLADTFDLTWPGLSNHLAYLGDRRTQGVSWWLDQTKAPFV